MRWAEFQERCRAHVQKIRSTKDDGVYARLYADDVERLLRTLDEMERLSEFVLVEQAFERAKA